MKFKVKDTAVPFWRFVQAVVRKARPKREPGQSLCWNRLEWRIRIMRFLRRGERTSRDYVVVTEGLSEFLVHGNQAYRLMFLHASPGSLHASETARLQTNQHAWLSPGAAQRAMFAPDPPPLGSEEFPIPLGVCPDGNLYVGLPDFITERGVGFGMSTAVRVDLLPRTITPEALAPAPDEQVPPLLVPKVIKNRKKKTGP
ncbi:MAG TPA: hypothetical protein VEB22_15345 [Phycisphaerales bacterium]|nr:hypothetical protein [Phycisphaerales bacterium]